LKAVAMVEVVDMDFMKYVVENIVVSEFLGNA
jgi:hypothetical protein